mgnify:CR=1 FL=1
MKTKIRKDGRLVIPATYRKVLGLKPGDEVHLILENGEIRIMSVRQAISRAQTLLRKYIPEGRNLSQELIQDRKDEVSHD